jgi:hypothetical protein
MSIVAERWEPIPAERMAGLHNVVVAVTATAGILSLVGLFVSGRDQFAFSALTAFVFALTLALGGLFWTLMHHLTDAGWSVVVRRLFEHFSRALPYLGLLLAFILAVGMTSLYQWSDASRFTVLPEHDEVRELWERKQFYLNVPFFLARAMLFFGVWISLSLTMSRMSARQDETGEPALTRRMQQIAPAGVLLLGLTSTFAAFDWIMGLDFYWYSTIFGVWFWAASIGGSMAAMILFVFAMRSYAGLADAVGVEHLHDMGKLTFGFMVFWAYVSFAQYFLIWYANLPEETRFYKIRQSNNWEPFGWTLAVGHFVLPLFLLMPRTVKRTPLLLGLMAGWMLTFHYLDLYYQVMPNLHPDDLHPHWLDATCLVTAVGVMALVVLKRLRHYPLVAVGDPRLAESLHFHNDTIDN